MPQNMRPLQFSRGSLSQIFIELFNLDFTFRYFITTCVVTASILSDVWTGKITLWWCFGYQIHDWNSPSEGETTRLLSPEEAQRHHFSYRVLMASRHDLYRFRGVRISPKSKVELIFPKVIRCNIYIYQYLKQLFGGLFIKFGRKRMSITRENRPAVISICLSNFFENISHIG